MVVGQAKPDVAIVGGGPIGLASAWRAAQSGLRVTVLDAGEPGAWHVAAGMLAPVAESSVMSMEARCPPACSPKNPLL